MICLAANKFVPEFCKKVAEGGGGVILHGGWDGISSGRWMKPVGSADGDKSEAKTTTVPYRTESIPFSTIEVFVCIVNGRVV